MNEMYSFNPEEKRQRMAQMLENYVLPQEKFQMPQAPAQNNISPLEVAKFFDKKKPNPMIDY